MNGSFEGGGRRVWEYGNGNRPSFYRGALEDIKIDQLASPWDDEDSAKRVVDALEAVARRVGIATTSPWIVLTTLGLTLLSIAGWLAALIIPTLIAAQAPGGEASVVTFFVTGFFASIGLAGLLGGVMQSLRRLRDGHKLEGLRPVVDVILGLAAGIVTAMLFLIAQLVIKGEIEFPSAEKDFLRIALLGSMMSLFAALYLDSALARFDKIKGSVLQGKFEG